MFCFLEDFFFLRMGIMDVQLLTVDTWYLRLQGGWVYPVRQISIRKPFTDLEHLADAQGVVVDAVNLIWSEQTILSTTPRPSCVAASATYRPTATTAATTTWTETKKFLKISLGIITFYVVKLLFCAKLLLCDHKFFLTCFLKG